MEVFNEIRDQDEIIDYSRLNFIGSSKKYTFKFGDFMSLGNLAENIYNGNISLDAAKQEQRKMENMLESLIDYSPIKDMNKSKKVNILLNAREFYKGRIKILIAFEEIYFHCLNYMCLVKMNEKKYIFLITKNLCQKNLLS